MLKMRNPQVVGYREAVRDLKKVDPQLQRDLNKTMRRAAAPLVEGVRRRLPQSAPMSGWTSGRYAYDASIARRGVKAQVGGRASTRRSVWPLLAVTQKDAGGSVFDIAGRRSAGNSPQGQAFIRTLNNRYGRASRSMWPGVEKNMEAVQKEVLAAIDDTAKTINRSLKRRRW